MIKGCPTELVFSAPTIIANNIFLKAVWQCYTVIVDNLAAICGCDDNL